MCAVHGVLLSCFGDEYNVYEKKPMKNRCCASSSHFCVNSTNLSFMYSVFHGGISCQISVAKRCVLLFACA